MHWEVNNGLAFPTLTSITVSVIIFLVGAPIVYLLSKALKLSPKSITISDPRKEAIPVFLVIIATFVITSALNVFVNTIVKPSFQLDKRPQFTFDYNDVLVAAFGYFIVFLPLIMAMKRNKQNRASIGINKEHRRRMFALGLVLSLIYIMIAGFFAPSLGGGFIGFSSSLVYGFIYYAIVGFSEEIVWRGYIQTRLIAYSSTAKGLITTALLFSLAHFPTRYYLFSGVILEAFTSSLLLLPISLLFGYIMLKSQNILPSSIFHLLSNWSTILWQIPAF
jgi:membrane protease YdiL (CAAX protease family)